MNTHGLIYCWINKINGKIYVGKTTNLKIRLRDYRCLTSKFRRQPKLHNAVLKYGWDNFSLEIIEESIPVENLNSKEKYWIRHLCTVEFGYNCTYGADGPNNISEETREKIKMHSKGENNPNYGKKHSAETRAKISKSNSGEKHPNYGKRGEEASAFGFRHTAETKQRLKELFSGPEGLTYGQKRSKETIRRMQLANKKHMIQVICNETGEIFESQRETCRRLDIAQTTLRKHLSNELKHAKGLTFKVYFPESS